MTWGEILVFVQKWWLEFVLAGIGTGLTFTARHYFKIAKDVKRQAELEKQSVFKQELTNEVKSLIKDVRDQIRLEIQQESTQVREEIAEYETNDCERITDLERRTNILEDTLTAVVGSLDIIKEGLLAIQGHEFRNKCRRLLAKDTILLDEYEQLESDHMVYNELGGNHKGDSLFDQVKTKYYAQLKN